MKITVNVEKSEIIELIKGYIKDNLNMEVSSIELTADGATVTSETKKENTSTKKEEPKVEVKETVKETVKEDSKKASSAETITAILSTNNLFN